MTAQDPNAGRDRHVRRTGDNYTAAFLSLLPTGQAWAGRGAPDSTLYRVCDGLSQYWGCVDGRAADLLEIESDPRRTREYHAGDPCLGHAYGDPVRDGLLPEWERAFGLPDPCYPDATSEEDRRRMLVLQMTLLGGQSREFFEKISAWTGKTIKIVEFAPFMAGISECGDTRYEYDQTGEYRWYIGPEELRFYWGISSDDAVLEWFRCGTGGSEAGIHHHLEIYVESPLDCLLRRWKPAQTELVFDYSQLATSNPWEGLP